MSVFRDTCVLAIAGLVDPGSTSKGRREHTRGRYRRQSIAQLHAKSRTALVVDYASVLSVAEPVSGAPLPTVLEVPGVSSF